MPEVAQSERVDDVSAVASVTSLGDQMFAPVPLTA